MQAVCILLECCVVTDHQESCGKVMFSQVSVNLLTWGGVGYPLYKVLSGGWNICNGFEITFVLEKHVVEDNVLFTNHLVGK